MIGRLLIAIVLGLVSYFVADLFLPYTVSVLIGVAVGLFVFFGDVR